MKGNKISIIVPVYNVEEFVEECIRSIVNQSYGDLEIILVDDGSTDDSGIICDAWAENDSRICVYHQQNKGLVNARKQGLLRATGEYVIFVDSDDWIDSGMCEEAMRIISATGVMQVEFAITDVNQEFKTKRKSCFEEGAYQGENFRNIILPRAMYRGDFFEYGIAPYACNKVFRKDLITEQYLKLNDEARIFEGAVCEFSYLVKSDSIFISHNSFYNYRYRENSVKHKFLLEDERALAINQRILFQQICESSYADILLPQFLIWRNWAAIWKCPQLFDNKEEGCFLCPFGGVRKGEKIALYGAGAVGTNLYGYLENVCGIRVKYWTDRQYDSLKRNLPLCAIEELISGDYDVVIIAILRADSASNAMSLLLQMGIDKSKIRWVQEKYIYSDNIEWEKMENE